MFSVVSWWRRGIIIDASRKAINLFIFHWGLDGTIFGRSIKVVRCFCSMCYGDL